MEKYSDEWVLKGLKSSNEQEKNEALKKMYTQHFSVIQTLVKKYNGLEDDAADVFQDAIIVFYEKVRLDQLQLNCSIQTYLYSVCKNIWLNKLRTQKKITRIDDEIESIPIDSESLSVLILNEQNELIGELLEQLGEGCKKILSLYYFERLRMKDISKKLGLANEQGAKNKKSRCLKKLRDLIDQSALLKNKLR